LRVLVLIADAQRGLGFMAATNPDSLPLRMPLEEWFDRYQYTVTSNIGETAVTSISVSDIPVSVEDVWQLPLCYGHYQGLPELREAIAAGYPGLTADDIIVTTGASEAIVLLATVLLEGRSARAVNRAPYLSDDVPGAAFAGCAGRPAPAPPRSSSGAPASWS
jgi:aspartate/methionine/tyrosine aminotransferase